MRIKDFPGLPSLREKSTLSLINGFGKVKNQFHLKKESSSDMIVFISERSSNSYETDLMFFRMGYLKFHF